MSAIKQRGPTANRAALIAIAAGFVVLGGAFAVSLVAAPHWTGAALALLDRLRDLGWRGRLVFVAVEAAIALIGVFPASLLGVAAGALYGVTVGFPLAALGLIVGALIAFAITRSAFRPAVARLVQRSAALGRFDAALARDGWRLVLLVRVSPAMPFSITSYALALSGVRLRDYAIGTLASLPALLVYVVLGTFGSVGLAAVQHGAGGARLALLAAGVAATILIVLRLRRIVAEAAADRGPDAPPPAMP